MRSRGLLFRKIQETFRKKRFRFLLDLVDRELEFKDRLTILDVGGSQVYWNMLPSRYRDKLEIHCLNFESEFEKYSGLEADINLKVVAGDGCDMKQYEDDEFDIVHSNSVVEHVGSLQNMKRFASETARVGRCIYIQTPNFWFPIEPHYAFPFIHWFPDPLKLWIFTHIELGYAHKQSFEGALVRVDHTRMLSRYMMRRLYPEATIKMERIAVFAKSIIAIQKCSDDCGQYSPARIGIHSQ